jgi:hypothetical protein
MAALHERDPALEAAWALVMVVVVATTLARTAPLGSVCCVHVVFSLFFDV